MPSKTRGHPHPKRKRILVVGDWLVDEHWVTGVHRSPTSSRTGKSHFRALQLPDSTTQSFCGAGRTASILHLAGDPKRPYFDVTGLGVWHPDDTVALSAMMERDQLQGHTPHRITQRSSLKNRRSRLFNLAELHETTTGRIPYGTTRVIRVYQHTGDKIGLIERIDWEVAPSEEQFPWVKHPDLLNKQALRDFLDLDESPCDAVVLKDLCKGVVSPELITWLKESIPAKIPWYISTKAWFPEDLLKQLRDVNLRLLMIPSVAAQTALRKNVLNTWTTGPGHISKGAIKQIDRIWEHLRKPRDLRIIALPDTSTIVCLDRLAEGSNKQDGILCLETGIHDENLPLPMASVFLAALIAYDVLDPALQAPEVLSKSLSFTASWRSTEQGRIEKPESWTPEEEQGFHLDQIDEKRHAFESFDWEVERENWNDAFKGLGFINSEHGPSIELWRSMTEVEGYVCCVEAKREVLQVLVRALRAFSSDPQIRNKSCMLVAPPGSGKTHLVRCLARSSGLRNLRFNITQMVSKADILDCFDTIVTTQAQSPGEPILVFVDEINAKLGAQYVYDSFLAPLDEGVYVRAGKAFHIDPCFWLFAGTEKPRDSVQPGSGGGEKASDFESRLSLPLLDLRVTGSDEARVEKVYLGAAILQATYPDVHAVTEKVLDVFHRLREDLAIRDLVHFVRTFRDIQYGEVTSKNVPVNWLAEYENPEDEYGSGVDVSRWKGQEEGRLIQIVG